VVAALAVFVLGCQTPAQRFLHRAEVLGLRAEVVRGTQFEHVILRPARASSATVHVYLDHDGTPWLGDTPSADPTPRNDLTLRLMALDAAPSVYVGRPCYVGRTADPGCSPQLWTSARYSEVVVASMTAALERVLSRDRPDRVVWFGYSGGGVLAMLAAPRVRETVAVVTVAANLDTEAWARHHGWPALGASLNPATGAPARAVYRRHYAGGRDVTVPVDLVRRAAPPADRVVVMPDYDHVCCWDAAWPRILADVAGALEQRPR
jgi:pimeloyl-ACP methyl ester carboxylesterase